MNYRLHAAAYLLKVTFFFFISFHQKYFAAQSKTSMNRFGIMVLFLSQYRHNKVSANCLCTVFVFSFFFLVHKVERLFCFCVKD